LEEAIAREFPEEVSGLRKKVFIDYEFRPISRKFINTCAHLEIERIFTTYENPKGNNVLGYGKHYTYRR